MGYEIQELDGVGPAFAERLRDVVITTTDDLLTRCANRSGRSEVSTDTGISETLILKWTNMADLMRIRGVGEGIPELLEASGVDTIKELRDRDAENLAEKMMKINAERHFTKYVPSILQVEVWVAQARDLPSLITR